MITYVTPPGQVDVFGATGGFPNPMTTKGDIIYENELRRLQDRQLEARGRCSGSRRYLIGVACRD